MTVAESAAPGYGACEHPPARWLALDGALGPFSVALISNATGEAPRTARAAGNDALELGLALVDEVLDGRSFAALSGLAVGTGPGSYTGLRIALAYAKSLAFATGLPLVGISSYDAYEPEAPLAPHATFVHGRTGIACARYRNLATEKTVCGAYEAIAAALAQVVPPGHLDSYGAAEGVAPALGERGIIVRSLPSPVDHPALAIAYRASRGATPTVVHALRPDYGEQAHYALLAERKGAGLGP